MRILGRTALGALFVSGAILLAACGGGSSVPDGAVAKLRDTTISKATFDHWLGIYARSAQEQQAQQTGSKATGAVVVPMPPDYADCVAAKTKAASKGKAEKPAVYRRQCKTEFEALRGQAMSLLITADWVAGEAKDQGIRVTDKQLDKAYADWRKANFPKESDFKAFVDRTGMTVADIRFQLLANEHSTKLSDKIAKAATKPTDKAIADYYAKNKSDFGQPERRDLRVVLTKTKSAADRARAAISAGQSWKTVARKYSIDQATKNVGGVLLAVSKGVQDRALDAAVFAAEKGKLGGPLKTQFGYYVFEVTKITGASQQTLEQATPTIKTSLSQQRQQQKLQTFVEEYQKKWRSETVCRDPYTVSQCKNSKQASTTTTSATTTG